VLATAAAGTEFRVGRQAASAGRYYCILDGSVLEGSLEYSRLALGWVDGDTEPGVLVAGTRGCSLLALDFPDPPTREQRSAAAAG
jgi:hypothetical protein